MSFPLGIVMTLLFDVNHFFLCPFIMFIHYNNTEHNVKGNMDICTFTLQNADAGSIAYVIHLAEYEQ